MGNALYEEIDRLKKENKKLRSEILTFGKLWERHNQELEKQKSKVKEYRAALALVERDRDFWHDLAARGGGRGNGN